MMSTNGPPPQSNNNNNNNLSNDPYARPALSPVGSEWSGISRYQSFQSVDGGPPPAIPPPRNGSLPPGRRPSQASMNGGPGMMDRGGPMGMGGPMDRGMGGPMGGMGGPMDRGMGGPMDRGMGGPPMSPMDRNMPMSPMDGGPSPPASIARSSDTTGLYSPATDGGASLQGLAAQEQVAARYATLKRLLGQNLTELSPGFPRVKTNAQEKLVKLSHSQFAELSEDIHDELCRREGIPDPNDDPGQNGEIPPYLPARDMFYYKRNQARMRLAKLPIKRFRTLASDIFYELERRYPHLCGKPGRTGSPTGSADGRQFPPQRINSPGPGRVGSPGPNGMRNGPGGPGGPGGYGVPPRIGTPSQPMRNGPAGGAASPGPNGPQNQFGRPLPKTFQANTIIPNISTMVEEGDDDNESYGGDIAAYEGNDRDSRGSGPSNRTASVKSRRSVKTIPEGSSPSSNEADKKLISDYQAQVATLTKKIEELEASVAEKEEKLKKGEDDERKRETTFNLEKKEWQDMRLNLEEKVIDAQKLNSSLQNEIARLKADNAAVERSLNQQLEEQTSKHQEQMRKLRAEHEDELRERGPIGSGGASGDMQMDALIRENEQLKMDLREQEEVTEEVRREATEFLEQMRELTQNSEQAWEREEELQQQVKKLEDEVKEWKSKYARIKSQLRSIRAASMGLPLGTAANLLGKEGNLKDPNGLVKDIYITKYQIAIDDLLRMARNGEPAVVLDYMKTVIMATRQITQDIDDSQPADGASADAIMKAKTRVSATANNLITASKNHATGSGLSPVSLLDAAASHLTASMVELIKLAKIRPTPADEVEEYEVDNEDEKDFDSSRFPNPPNMVTNGLTITVNGVNGTAREINGTNGPSTNGVSVVNITKPNGLSANGLNGNVPNGAPRYSAESVYSDPHSSPPRSQTSSPDTTNYVISPPAWKNRESSRNVTISSAAQIGFTPPKNPAFGIRTSTTNVEDLRLFVETQFEGIVESIQSLLSVIRSDGEIPLIQSQILEIATVVGKVLDSTESSMSQTGNLTLRERGDWIVKNLGDCRVKMLAMAEEDPEDKVSKAEIKEFKSRLAGLAFNMAREIKELVRTVEDIDNEVRKSQLGPAIQIDDDDFR